MRCPACGHRQIDPMPADAVLESAYADAASEDYVDEEAGQRETARRALARIEAHLLPSRATAARATQLLDLGCWVGFLLAEARERGWDGDRGRAVAVRVGVRARPARPRRPHRATCFEAELPLGHYDAVVMGDVIEHLPRPGEALDRMADAAAPRRRRVDGAARRRQPRRAPARAALVVGDPDARAVLHARARSARCSSATAGRCSRSRPRRRPSACATTSSGSAATRRRLARLLVRGARARAGRRPHVGAGLPRPHGGHRAGAGALMDLGLDRSRSRSSAAPTHAW